MKPVKVWSSDRKLKKFFVAKDFTDLLTRGADKLGMPETTSVVLEEDGTEIDEESFNYLPDGTTFILLRSNEKWRKPEDKDEPSTAPTTMAACLSTKSTQRTLSKESLGKLGPPVEKFVVFTSCEEHHNASFPFAQLGRQMFTAGKPTFLFLLFFALQEQAACEEVEHNESKHSEDHNRFDRRIEAPNKTLILNNIFKGYDKRLRPHYREKPVLVSLHAVIDSFHAIKEEEMEYKVEVVLKETWNDPRLAYGNSSWFVRLKGSTLAKVWYPDTLIENSRKHDVDDKTRTAYLFGDGTIFLSEWIKATLTSHMEFHQYPMDVQTLRMQIAGYSYDDSQVKYEWSSVKLREKDMTEFYVDKESLREESTMFITGTHTAVVAEFQIKRRLQHFIIGFYLPCITCTCASWIQFWMEPRDIAGRAGIGTATVLAEILLLEFSNQGMPKVSYVKAAELFMVVSFTFICSALVESAVVFKFCDIFPKRKMEDSEGDTEKCNSGCDRGNESMNKTVTTAVLSPRPSNGSSKESSVCDEAVNRPIEVILPNQPEHAWKQPCFHAEQSAKTTKSWASKIDDGARLCFPLSYAIFTVLYFVLTLCLRP